MSRINKTLALIITLFISSFLSAPSANATGGKPAPWQMGFQDAATENMAQIIAFNNFLLILMTIITLFVMGLMLYVMIRFNARANPNPSKTTHNTTIEIIWTIVPIIILVIIAVPSFKLLHFQRNIPQADITIKATGYQWYWGYEYPDHDNLAFDALMLEEDDPDRGSRPRLLATDNVVVLPVGATVRVIVTAADVLHSWAVPAFGVKMDAVPGRLNETWFKINKKGVYYGQCSELCGIRHAFMPIEIYAVDEKQFNRWLKWAKQEYAANQNPETIQRAIAQMRTELTKIGG